MAYNPKSLENLKKGRLRGDDGSASRAGKASVIAKRTQRQNEAIIDAYMNDLIDMAFGKSTLKQFQQKATEAPSQALRVVALNLANPKTAMAALQWLVERVKGKPKQTLEGAFDTSVTAEKPVVVFRDIAGKE